jgi:hypothetical protein
VHFLHSGEAEVCEDKRRIREDNGRVEESRVEERECGNKPNEEEEKRRVGSERIKEEAGGGR